MPLHIEQAQLAFAVLPGADAVPARIDGCGERTVEILARKPHALAAVAAARCYEIPCPLVGDAEFAQLILAKSAEAKRKIVASLNRRPPVRWARFYDFAVDVKGLTFLD